jgi:hypothetical protein
VRPLQIALNQGQTLFERQLHHSLTSALDKVEHKLRLEGICRQPPGVAVRFHDRAVDLKSHAGFVRLRGKESTKYLAHFLLGLPHADIRYRYISCSVSVCCEEIISSRGRSDSMPSIKVNQRLLQLHAISYDLAKMSGQFGVD